jgi:dihydropyrimidinase
MPFMGTYSTDDFESGTRAVLAGGNHYRWSISPCRHPVRLTIAPQMCNKSTRANCDYSFHMAVTWWANRCSMRWSHQDRGINTFKHPAYKARVDGE